MDRYKYLTVDIKNNKIAIVEMNSNQPLNLLSSGFISELMTACVALNEDEAIHVVILTGGKTSFIAGTDIKEMTGLSVSQAFDLVTKIKALQEIIMESSKPFIAAISGYCLGGGFELALVCDFRVASSDAVFGLPQINLGIIPGGGGVTRLVEIAGQTAARKMVLTGDLIPATRALDWNIISDLTDSPVDGALVIAHSLASKSKRALATAKRLLNQKMLSSNQNHAYQEMQAFTLLFDYPDSVEGMGAFLEGRKPSF
ncbi:enoyl-CoA hydratase/isomerase family protein [Mesobacillus maritimus]|uniref:enoyl-CoA hydratase/isomerase family protein n=1 Tax=Mesobacillus maritimus TaxID=1643336 RepID=UPI00203C0B5E|nr:enoyl-CoA hydratase/isomerase family protein [Mesobacillus maritimus]MCM3669372.1 enoyl-CoA hydratase/isomerase family protein [Mesobacillus maritimus]